MPNLVLILKRIRKKITQEIYNRDTLDAALDIEKRRSGVADPKRPKLKPSIAQV